MAVVIATLRRVREPGPALRRGRVPVGGTRALRRCCTRLLVAAILISGHVWRTTQPKAYVVNLVPAIAAVGSPQGRTRAPEPTPTPPKAEDQRADRRRAALPEREPTRAPERTPTRPTELPDRPAGAARKRRPPRPLRCRRARPRCRAPG